MYRPLPVPDIITLSALQISAKAYTSKAYTPLLFLECQSV